jgi:hypothetical protein
MAGDRTRIGLWRPQVGLHGGRRGVHVHFAMHIPAERYDAAVAHLRGQGQEVAEQAFSNRGGRPTSTTPTATSSSCGRGTWRST